MELDELKLNGSLNGSGVRPFGPAKNPKICIGLTPLGAGRRYSTSPPQLDLPTSIG
jgi:hypothetical protein